VKEQLASKHQVPRRDLLKMLGIGGVMLGAGPAVLAACSSSSGTSTAAGASASSSSTALADLQTGVLLSAFDPMDPAVSSNGLTINLFWFIYEALFAAGVSDPTTFAPQLAAGEPTMVNDTTYKVTVRPGAKFSDGSAVTADDVAFSFNRVIGLGPKSFLGQYLTNFKTVTASGANEVTFTLKKPSALFKQRVATVKILKKSAVQGASASSPVLNYAPIGSGPYKVTSADPSSGAKLAMVSTYNGPLKGKLAAKAVTMNVITDANARVAALQSNSANAITFPPADAFTTLKNTPGIKATATPAYATHLTFFNANKAPFSDYRVRQAYMYGIDRNALVQGAYNGLATVADTLVLPSSSDYTKPSTIYTHDPAKAKRLLAQAGFPHGFTFELQVGTEDASMVAAGQIIQQQLKEIGLTVKIRSGDTGGLYTRVTNGQYQAMYAGTSPALLGSADAEFVYRWLYYGAFVDQYVYWKGPVKDKITTLLDQAVASTSTDQYNTTMAQVEELVAQQGPTIPIVHPSYLWANNTKTSPDAVGGAVGVLVFGRDV
jgi:peptide/nickel transport system substrate-binding protein